MSATLTAERVALRRRLVEAAGALFGSTQPDALLAARLFLRGLGAVYLVAFIPWITQIVGLVGSGGVVPAATFLDTVYEAEGLSGVLHFPSLAWFYAGDPLLQALPIVGAALAVLLLFGYANTVVLGALWVLYLSIVTITGDYGLYGWNGTLLEAGFLALFLVPLRLSLRKAPRRAPPRLVVWAFWFLVFRLWFSMGMVKFYGGDRAWLDLTFLTYFYPNQPMPSPGAWLLAQLPLWVHKGAVIGVAVVELLVPFLIFWNRKTRLVAAVVFTGTSLFLFVAGHYAFFHLLALLLGVMLLDDAHVRRLLPSRWSPVSRDAATSPRGVRWANGMAVFLMLLGGFYVLNLFLPGGRGFFNHLNFRVFDPDVRERTEKVPPLDLALGVVRASSRFYLVNPMGEFKRIVKRRFEVVFEGSMDGETWYPYTFHGKPDDVHDLPAWDAPLMDHLGTQLYYEAQGIPFYRFDQRSTYDEAQPPRLLALARRLHEAAPDVLRLLDDVPFDGRPPTFVRCTWYRFEFSDIETLRREGAWWRREFDRLLLSNYPEGGETWHGPLLEPPFNGRLRPVFATESQR